MMPSPPPFHKQEFGYSCVPACLRMVLLSLGVDVAESRLRESCDSTPMGTDALKAIDTLRALGFAASGKHTLSSEELPPLLAQGHFPIVFVSFEQRHNLHALVVIDMTEVTVTVLDPMIGERLLSYELFMQAWRRGRFLTILVEH